MKFTKTPITLKDGETVTSLYHSPFDLNLFYIIWLAKSGLKLRVILDDIDNIGVDRTDTGHDYAFEEKYFLSKTERTNMRALSLITPKHLIANLSDPELRELDKCVGVKKLKDGLRYDGTVEHWIQHITREMGSFSIIGPDRAFAFAKIDDSFIRAVESAKVHICDLISRISCGNEESSDFINWLLEINPTSTSTISDYYHGVLVKVIRHFGLEKNVHIERMSDALIQDGNRKLLQQFSADKSVRSVYEMAVALDGKKDSIDVPFYSVSKKDGQRLLTIGNYTTEPSEYLIAPNVFMLNNFENLLLPYHAIDKTHVHARELMYSHKEINCNQVFCDDSWLEWVASFDTDVNLDEIEERLYNKTKISLAAFPESLELSNEALATDDFQKIYKEWIFSRSGAAIQRFKYPLLFLAILQNEVFYKGAPNFYKLVAQ